VFQEFWAHLFEGFIDLWVFQPPLFKFGNAGHVRLNVRLNDRLNGVILRGNPAFFDDRSSQNFFIPLLL